MQDSTEGPRPTPQERVRRLSGYGPGWDGYQAKPANPVGIAEACAFLDALGTGPAPLDAELEPDGSVDLVFDVDGCRTVLSFAGDGRVEAMRRTDGAWREIGVFDLGDPQGRIVVAHGPGEPTGRPGYENSRTTPR